MLRSFTTEDNDASAMFALWLAGGSWVPGGSSLHFAELGFWVFENLADWRECHISGFSLTLTGLRVTSTGTYVCVRVPFSVD